MVVGGGGGEGGAEGAGEGAGCGVRDQVRARGEARPMVHWSAGDRMVAKAGVVTRAATSVGPTTHGSARSCCRLLADSSSAVARQGGWRRGTRWVRR